MTADGVGLTARISGFTVTGGKAAGFGIEGLNGGGILVRNSNAVITRSRLKDNASAGGNGGGVHAVGLVGGSANPVLVDCSFINNKAGQGGGLRVEGIAAATVVNCLFSSNFANAGALLGGGAISANGAALDVINSTFTQNLQASGVGAGGAVWIGGNSQATIRNSILWGDDAFFDPEIHVQSGSLTVTYSDVQGGWNGNGTNNIDEPPQFANLASDFHLTASSPCIDRGSNSDVQVDTFDVNDNHDPGEYTPDLDMKPRVLGAVGGCAAVVDMGAYEFVPTGCPGDCAIPHNGQVDIVDFLAMLGQWGQQPCGSCDFLAPPGVGITEFLYILGAWGPCAAPGQAPPKTVSECMQRYGFDPLLLQNCICAVAPCTQGCPPGGCH